MNEDKFLPEGFRFLNTGEAIKKDDYFWDSLKRRWIKIHFDADTSSWVEEQVIRKLDEKNKRWQKTCDEFEEKVDANVTRSLTPTEQKGYKNLKRFIKKLREREVTE